MNPNIQREYLTIGQLSSYLGWSPRFIDGFVRGGYLPGLEIDGHWHFRRDDVVDWLEQKIQTLDSARVTELEEKLESGLLSEGTFRTKRNDRLASRLSSRGVGLDIAVPDKPGVLRALADLAESTGLLYDRDYLLASLVDRESLCSTAMPGGIAVCHPRRPLPLAIERQFLCFLRTAEPVDFGADDGSGTSLFFLICAPDDSSHLYGLARLARVLHSGATDALRIANDPEAVIAVLSEFESAPPTTV